MGKLSFIDYKFEPPQLYFHLCSFWNWMGLKKRKLKFLHFWFLLKFVFANRLNRRRTSSPAANMFCFSLIILFLCPFIQIYIYFCFTFRLSLLILINFLGYYIVSVCAYVYCQQRQLFVFFLFFFSV